MTRTLDGRPAKPRPQSLFQRAKIALDNCGVYVPGVANVYSVLKAIHHYEGKPKPMGINFDYGTRQVEEWLAKQEGAPVSSVPVYSRPELKLSREMRAALARCNPKRLPE